MILYYDRKGNPMEMMAWAKAFEKDNAVAKTKVGEVSISTVWLGLDHGSWDDGPPLIFETMIFGDEYYRDYQERYSTEEEALAGHEKAVALVRGESNDPGIQQDEEEETETSEPS